MIRLIKLSKIATVLAMLVSILSIVCTYKGIFDPQIYGELFAAGKISENLFFGSIGQDIINLPVSILLFALCVIFLLKPMPKVLIAIIGIVWCEFYSFGLYTIQGQYTDLYPLYLTIFSISIYSMIMGIVSFNRYTEDGVILSKLVRLSTIGFLLIIPILMIPIWILRLAPNIAIHTASEVYGVFVLDLGIVFPAIIIIIVMLIKNIKYGKVLAGVALMKVCMLCLSWGFAELYVPLNTGTKIAAEMLVIASFFTLVSGILLIPYFKHLKIVAQE